MSRESSHSTAFNKTRVEPRLALQIGLGRLRRASGHFDASLLAADPHHMRSYTKRQMRRHRHKSSEQAIKTLQCFFCLDAKTHQPVAFTLGCAAQTSSVKPHQFAPRWIGLATARLPYRFQGRKNIDPRLPWHYGFKLAFRFKWRINCRTEIAASGDETFS